MRDKQTIERTVKLLSQWKLEAEFCNYLFCTLTTFRGEKLSEKHPVCIQCLVELWKQFKLAYTKRVEASLHM